MLVTVALNKHICSVLYLEGAALIRKDFRPVQNDPNDPLSASPESNLSPFEAEIRVHATR